MIEVLWDVDPLDWKTDNADAVVERVVTKCQENDIIYYMMHTTLPSRLHFGLSTFCRNRDMNLSQ